MERRKRCWPLHSLSCGVLRRAFPPNCHESPKDIGVEQRCAGKRAQTVGQFSSQSDRVLWEAKLSVSVAKYSKPSKGKVEYAFIWFTESCRRYRCNRHVPIGAVTFLLYENYYSDEPVSDGSHATPGASDRERRNSEHESRFSVATTVREG